MPKIGDDALNIFHFVIIAFFVILINGCGYKANPYWSSVNLDIDSRGLDSSLIENKGN